jgi:type IV pilus assembly protein PilV
MLIRTSQAGTSLIEVLVTLVILAFGLLGIAGLQSKMGVAEVESYQRSQAVLLLADMAERIAANRAQAPAYAVGRTFGTGDTTDPADCSTVAQGPLYDLCEWSNELKGAGETASGSQVGGMTGAMGCIIQTQAPVPTLGICTPGVYQISVAWQGMNATKAPALACGQNSYGTDTYRRVIATTVTIGQTSCY